MVRVNPTGRMNYVCQYRRGRRIVIAPVVLLTPTQAREAATLCYLICESKPMLLLRNQ